MFISYLYLVYTWYIRVAITVLRFNGFVRDRPSQFIVCFHGVHTVIAE